MVNTRNLLFKLKYRGGAYHGWQVQKNALAVQEVVQNAVEKIAGKRENVTGCSRLDSGVHAEAYYFTVRTECGISEPRFAAALNTLLPKDMAVLNCQQVNDDFHPRYSAKSKTYVYKVWNSQIRNPFIQELAWHYPHYINIDKINAAAQAFLGSHDFSSFCASRAKEQQSHVRTIFEISAERDGDIIYFRVTGDGFLYNMVRIMTGTLIHMKNGNLTAEDIEEILQAKNRTAAGKTAPAHGLYLEDVRYEHPFSQGQIPL